MSQVIFIKHAMPVIDPEKPSALWELSEKGRDTCFVLAERLRRFSPEIFVTSTEPKARETGQLVANRLDVPCQVAPDLHEHDRTGVPFMPDKTTWQQTVKFFFEQPNHLILGRETATQALARFSLAVDQIQATITGTVAIATHGTVMALYIAQKTGLGGFDLWKQLDLPSFVVLSRPNFSLVEIVSSIKS